MSYQLNVKKLLSDLRGPKGIATLSEELVKVGAEVEKLKNKYQPQAELKIKSVRSNINDLQKKLKKAQTELDRELKKSITLVKKYGQQAEKKISKLAGSVSKRKPLKKASRKAPRSGTKKATVKSA